MKSPIKRYDRRNTKIPIRNPVTRESIVIREKPTISTFGGPRTSSVLTVILSRLISSIEYIVTEYTKSPDRNKYIRKVQDCKVFYRDEVYNMPDEYTFVCMRQRSGKYKGISDIKQFRLFGEFLMDILI